MPASLESLLLLPPALPLRSTGLCVKRGIAVPPRRSGSAREADESIGRTVPAVRSLINTGQLPFVQCGRRISLDLKALAAWIAANKN